MGISHDLHPAIVIRLATPEDVPRLNRLAALDSQRAPRGPMLLAELGGVLQAAVALDGSRAIADPWRRTAELVVLLRLRADQMPAELGRGRQRDLVAVQALAAS